MPSNSVPDSDLKGLVADGLRALKGGADQAQDAASDVQDAATHPDLKDALKKGEQTTQQWQDRIDRAMSEMGADGKTDNPVIEGVYDVAQRTRQEASTDDVRDLGIIASGQLALHYWIAAFGTVATYAKALDNTGVADSMSQCVTDARQADEQHTRIAEQILGIDA